MDFAKSLVASLLLAASAAPAVAELCVIDAVPAATILVPYFEVNLRDRNKSKFERTKVTLINSEAAPAIAHVILWTDLSVPTLNFDILLTGFDVQEFDVDRLFTHGQLPLPTGQGIDGCTACDGSGCSNYGPSDEFTGQDLVNAHTGSPVAFYQNQCAAGRSGDVARGYITIDNVNQCSVLFPNDSGYFQNGGGGVANNLNALQATITTYSSKFLREVPAFHIEAGTSDGLSTDGNMTFYGRFVDFNASDNRECGGARWSIPFRKRDKFKTEAIVWRDSGAVQGPFACSDSPDWFPLGQTSVIAFDQQENSRDLSSRNAFPAETQLVSVGKNPISTGSFEAGWLSLDLSTSESFGHGFVIARQRYRSREGDAWGELTDDDNSGVSVARTVCGGTVPSNLRAQSRRSRAPSAQNLGGRPDSGSGGSSRELSNPEAEAEAEGEGEGEAEAEAEVEEARSKKKEFVGRLLPRPDRQPE